LSHALPWGPKHVSLAKLTNKEHRTGASPIEHLGAAIYKEYRTGASPIEHLGAAIYKEYRTGASPIEHLGAAIYKEYRTGPLHTLTIESSSGAGCAGVRRHAAGAP
jgi:hypothetical protein